MPRERHYLISIEVLSDEPLSKLKKICNVHNYTEPEDLAHNLKQLLDDRPASIGCNVDEKPVYDEEA